MSATTPKGPFRCIPCNMSFPDASHQEIHNRTKFHKTNRDAQLYLKPAKTQLFNEEDIQ